jgi:hypothetical protein
MHTPIAAHLFVDMPSGLALGLFEMQLQFATVYVTPLHPVPAREGNNHVVDKVYQCERHALRQQVHHDEFLWVKEGCQC